MPSDLQQLLANAGQPHVVRWRDREWKLYYLDQQRKAAVIEKLKRAAMRELAAMKPFVDADSYKNMSNELVKACGAGEYDYFGPEHQRALKTQRGHLDMFRAILGDEQSALLSDEDVVEFADLPEVELAYAVIVEESLPPKIRPLFRKAREQLQAAREQASPTG